MTIAEFRLHHFPTTGIENSFLVVDSGGRPLIPQFIIPLNLYENVCIFVLCIKRYIPAP